MSHVLEGAVRETVSNDTKDTKPTNHSKPPSTDHDRNINSSNSHNYIPIDNLTYRSILKYEEPNYLAKTNNNHKYPSQKKLTESFSNCIKRFKIDNEKMTVPEPSTNLSLETINNCISTTKWSPNYMKQLGSTQFCKKYSVFGNDNFSLYSTAYAPQNVKPPIREPNMPEKRDKKDDKKEKKDRKPVIRTIEEMKDGMKCISIYFAPLDISGNMVTTRHKWGQIVTDTIPDVLSTHKHPTTTAIAGTKHMSTMDSSKDKTQISGSKSPNKNKINENVSESETSTKQPEVENSENPESVRQVLKLSTTTMDEISMIEDEYNIPHTAAMDTEISAWQDVVAKIKLPPKPKEEDTPITVTTNLNLVSIRPEPPEPKLDVETVKSLNSTINKQEEESDDSMTDMKTVEPSLQLSKQQSREQSIKVNDVPNRKMHTMKINTPDLLQNTPFNFKSKISVKNANLLYPFSTVPNDPNDPSDQSSKARNEQFRNEAKAQMSSKSSDMSSSHEKSHPILPIEPQEVWINQEGPTDIDAEFARNLNKMTEKELEMSLQPQEEEYSDLSSESLDQKQRRSDKNLSLHDTDNYIFDNLTKTAAAKDTAEYKMLRRERIIERKQIPPGDQISFIDDGDYVRVPGDPYPYSRDHFYRWRAPFPPSPSQPGHLPHGTPGFLKAAQIRETETAKVVQKSDQLPPIREMSYDVRGSRRSIYILSAHDKFLNRNSVFNTSVDQNRSMASSKIYASSLADCIIPYFLQGDKRNVNCRETSSDASLILNIPQAEETTIPDKMASQQ